MDNGKISSQLRERAEKLQPTIDDKLDPAIASQNLTARRAKIAGSMREDGYRLQRVQTILRGLADKWDADPGTVKDYYCDKVRFKPIILDILNKYTRLGNPRLLKADITTESQLQAARGFLEELLAKGESVGPTDDERALRAKEEALLGSNIPGFFPTPPELIRRMTVILEDAISCYSPVSVADILDQKNILEPSAGKGDIAEALRLRYPSSVLHTVEVNHTLAEILELKGFMVERADFLEIPPDTLFRAIVMNPPFEKGQDMAHIRHAYDLLEPGGQLVSIISEGPFYRQDKAATEFRDWLDTPDHELHDVDAGAFSKAFRSTGVKTRIIRISKPELRMKTW